MPFTINGQKHPSEKVNVENVRLWGLTHAWVTHMLAFILMFIHGLWRETTGNFGWNMMMYESKKPLTLKP